MYLAEWQPEKQPTGIVDVNVIQQKASKRLPRCSNTCFGKKRHKLELTDLPGVVGVITATKAILNWVYWETKKLEVKEERIKGQEKALKSRCFNGKQR